MKFIKVFADDAAYKAYRDSGDGYIRPNVSLSRYSKTVFYNLDANDKPYEDLGLPSGTLWATMNVGASKASDYGLYFQWGDTVGYAADQVGTGDGKKAFSWAYYKFNPSGDGKTFTKYTTTGAILDLEDDAAHINMGGDWHMPTPTQIWELLSNTTNTWTALDGVTGMKFTSKNGKSIFIPAAGGGMGSSVKYSGVNSYVWSSLLDMDDVFYGSLLTFNSGDANNSHSPRFTGLSVRGVIG